MSYAEGAQLWYCSFDGQGWDVDQQVPNVGLTDSPALAVFNNQLYCFHNGISAPWYEGGPLPGAVGQLWYNVGNFVAGEPGSITWEGDQKVPDVGHSESPALAVFNNQLYCIHQGYGDDGQLWYLASSSMQPAPISVEWFPDKQVPDAVLSTAPAAVVSG